MLRCCVPIKIHIARILPALLVLVSCTGRQSGHGNQGSWQPLQVTVSAYNSLSYQTDGHPAVAAWGDTLRPGMRCVAVSRDLLAKGLGHNTRVRLQGLPGEYLVKDKMHPRWRKKMDIYMGTDVAKAREWGRKKMTVHYFVPDTVPTTAKKP